MLLSKRLSQEFCGLGNKGNTSGEQGKQENEGLKMRGTGERRQLWETCELQILYLGNRGNNGFISGEQGNRYSPGRASSNINRHIDFMRPTSKKLKGHIGFRLSVLALVSVSVRDPFGDMPYVLNRVC